MRTTPIPAAEIPPGARRLVVSPPDGNLLGEVRAVEAKIDRCARLDRWRLSTRIVLEDGDVERLAAGEPIWLSFYDSMPVFSVGFADETATVFAPQELVDEAGLESLVDDDVDGIQ